MEHPILTSPTDVLVPQPQLAESRQLTNAGVEYAFDRHWSGSLEYDYYNFDTET